MVNIKNFYRQIWSFDIQLIFDPKVYRIDKFIHS